MEKLFLNKGTILGGLPLVPSDLRVHDPEWGEVKILDTFKKCSSFSFRLMQYSLKHLSENIPICTIDTMHGWLLLDSFKCMDTCSKAGLEVKKLGHFFYLFWLGGGVFYGII